MCTRHDKCRIGDVGHLVVDIVLKTERQRGKIRTSAAEFLLKRGVKTGEATGGDETFRSVDLIIAQTTSNSRN